MTKSRLYPEEFLLVDGLWVGDPTSLESDTSLAQWQFTLKFVGGMNQKNCCTVCGMLLRNASPIELHHALISREDVRGLPQYQKLVIHHTYNCLVLHHKCHYSITRQESWELLSNLYGLENLIGWYQFLPIALVRPRVEVYL